MKIALSPCYPSLSQFKRAVDGGVDDPTSDSPVPQTADAHCEPLSANTIRLLSWNLDGLSSEKASNPGVVAVVAQVLADYQINAACLQGISDPQALDLVKRKLNSCSICNCNRTALLNSVDVMLQLCEAVNKKNAPLPPFVSTATGCGVGYLHRVALKTIQSPIVNS